MILLGYLCIFSYVFIMLIPIGKLLLKITNEEFSRKIIHISLFVIWIFIDIFLKNTIHQILIPVIFTIINFISYKFKVFDSVEREKNNHFGTIYFGLSITIIYLISYFFNEFYDFTIYSVIGLTIGDGFASLIGNLIPSVKIYKSKSLSGFLACFFSSFIAFLIVNIFDKNFSLWTLLMFAIFCSILELVDIGLDNITITIGLLFISYFANMLGNPFIYALFFGEVIFIIVFFLKLIEYYGSLASLLIVFIFYFFGGHSSFIYLLICYSLSVVCGIIRKKIKNNKLSKSDKPRNFIQIFVNGLFPLIFIIVQFCMSDTRYLIMSYIVISSNLIDSISSDIGTLSNKKPYDFVQRKYVESGISGGISCLGTLSAFVVSIVLGIYITLLFKVKFLYCFLFIPVIFSGTVIDSILGSLIQRKNICPKCGKILESKTHCNSETVYYSGIKYIDNNLINLLSSFIVSLLSLFFLGGIIKCMVI